MNIIDEKTFESFLTSTSTVSTASYWIDAIAYGSVQLANGNAAPLGALFTVARSVGQASRFLITLEELGAKDYLTASYKKGFGKYKGFPVDYIVKVKPKKSSELHASIELVDLNDIKKKISIDVQAELDKKAKEAADKRKATKQAKLDAEKKAEKERLANQKQAEAEFTKKMSNDATRKILMSQFAAEYIDKMTALGFKEDEILSSFLEVAKPTKTTTVKRVTKAKTA